MYKKKKYYATNMREEVAKTILRHPEQTYLEIADEFCISKRTVERIASEYGVGRHTRK